MEEDRLQGSSHFPKCPERDQQPLHYMNNLILPLPPKEKKKHTKQSNRSFKRQFAVDGTFLLENLAIILFADLRLNVNDVWPLLVFVLLSQLCGTLLKVLYYRFFHIWSSILHMKDFEA